MASLGKLKNLLFQDVSTLAQPGAIKAALSGDAEVLAARLWTALEVGDEAGLRTALSLGADPTRCSAQGLTPLHHAARAGNLPELQVLLGALRSRHGPAAKGASAPPPALPGIDEPSAQGHTALSDAAAAGHTACVEALRAAGANINATGPRGVSVLHRAVVSDNAHLLRTLHEAGANWHARDVDGATPLDVLERVRPHAVASWRRRVEGAARNA